MSQKLIEAHEEERTRIARELHDDISQRLALVGVRLGVLKQSLPASAADLDAGDRGNVPTDWGSCVRYSGAVARPALRRSWNSWG